MRKRIICLFFLLSLFWPSIYSNQEKTDIVNIDFTMAEKAVEWLEFIKKGADDKSIKDYFVKNVASTKGCQAIIHHWARFRKWDNEEFYKFIMEALGRIPANKKGKNEDSSLSWFERRKMLWRQALSHPERIRKDINDLKKFNLKDKAIKIAKKYLPDDVVLISDFYFVLFGGSPAFSVGKENGFDVLQLFRTPDGNLYLEQIIITLAHELHHSGFYYCLNKHNPILKDDPNIMLLGTLVAEGMPTYFINRTQKNLEKLRRIDNPLLKMLVKDWNAYLLNLNESFRQAEKDVLLNLEGKLSVEDIHRKWLNGVQGQAYILGSYMFSVIDKYLGVEQAKKLVYNPLNFIAIYNKAAKLGNEQKGGCFVFSQKLVEKLSDYYTSLSNQN